MVKNTTQYNENILSYAIAFIITITINPSES
jgi:hypothetical protein